MNMKNFAFQRQENFHSKLHVFYLGYVNFCPVSSKKKIFSINPYKNSKPNQK